jgi:hypothetical protein
MIHSRSPHWSKVEHAFKLKYPNCAACSSTISAVQVHHIFPFHYCVELGRPDLELDYRNLITLCEGKNSSEHHLLLGHFDDFKSANLDVRDHVIKFKGWNYISIKSNSEWQELCKNKLKPLEEMTDEDKENFKELMNKVYP